MDRHSLIFSVLRSIASCSAMFITDRAYVCVWEIKHASLCIPILITRFASSDSQGCETFERTCHDEIVVWEPKSSTQRSRDAADELQHICKRGAVFEVNGRPKVELMSWRKHRAALSYWAPKSPTCLSWLASKWSSRVSKLNIMALGTAEHSSPPYGTALLFLSSYSYLNQ